MADLARSTADHSRDIAADDKFRLAVEASPSGIVMSNSAGEIVLVNAETERMFGYRRDELIGRHVGILIPQRLHAEYFKERAEYLRHPRTRRFGENWILIGRRRDGTEFPVEVGLNPIESGETGFVLSVIIDISERLRIDRLKDEFVSTVSHELRTPLTSIAASLALLNGGVAGALPESAARLVRIAESNSKRLVRLINDLLDMQKIESGQAPFKFKRLLARSLVEQVIEANRDYADSFDIRVRLEPAAASAEVYADPDRLTQVVTNLLSNAIKFSPRGSEVVVAIDQYEECVRIAVRDHGQGIPSEFRPHVFRKFAQADAGDSRQKGGTGLGLSIVKEIVSRLHGTVGFEDAIGGGTIFYVELPSWTQVARRQSDADATSHAARILLCEDDPDIAQAVRDGLRPSGFRTDFAHSPEDAVARAHEGHYEAIVVDLNLPDGNDVSLIKMLRAQPEVYKTPIVVISNNGGREKIAEAERAQLNVFECISKPVEIDHLAQILGRAVMRHGSGRAHILHIDDDRNVLEIVAQALGPIAHIVSADSIEEARFALALHQFDLAILDIKLGAVSGLGLLSDLHNESGEPIPVIIFTAHAELLKDSPQVQASFDKSSSASLNELVAAVRDRLSLKSAQSSREVP